LRKVLICYAIILVWCLLWSMAGWYSNNPFVQMGRVQERRRSEDLGEVARIAKQQIVPIGNEMPKLPSREGRTEKPRILTMISTAYSYTGSKTASGTWPKRGTVATDPEQIRTGTRMYITGYGWATAEDTGRLIKAPWNRKGKGRYAELDVYFNDPTEAKIWGRRTVKVVVYGKER